MEMQTDKWSLIMKRVEVLRNQGLRVVQDGDRTTIKPVTGCSIKGFKKIDILENGAYESLYKALSLYYKWEAAAYGIEEKSIEVHSYYSCMDCDWSGDISECEFDTEYDEMKGMDKKYPICPKCGGGLDC